MNASIKTAVHALPDVLPATGVLGAEIRNVDLSRPLAEEQWQAIYQAFLEHKVVWFRGQHLNDEQHVAFARRFGDLLKIPQLLSEAQQEYVQWIRRSAKDTGRVVGESWHEDSTYLPSPPDAVMMRAIELPEFGGDTAFLDMEAAWQALSPTMQKLLAPLNAVHSATRIFGAAYHAQNKKFDASGVNQQIDQELGNRECTHPLVTRHARSGKICLFVNRVYIQRIEGLSDAESAALLGFLYEHCSRYELSCRFRWQPGDLLIWDNRATTHKAIFDYPGKDRALKRVTIAGSPPQAAFPAA